MSELNPNHKTTSTVRDHWHKIAALLMKKANLKHVVITTADIDDLARQDLAIAIDDRPDGLHVSMVPMTQAVEMAKKEGGLPV